MFATLLAFTSSPRATRMNAGKSLTEHTEQELVRKLLAEPEYSNPFLSIDGIRNDASCFDTVPLSPLAETDVDVLVVDPVTPHQPTAFQVKRIKVEDSAFDTESPNGLGKLPKLHQQSKLLIDVGFWRVFSVVITVVDARLRTSDGNKYATLTQALQQAINKSLSTTELHPGLGLIHLDYIESFPGPVLHSGSGGTRMIRTAATRAQDPKVTSWIQRLIRPSS